LLLLEENEDESKKSYRRGQQTGSHFVKKKIRGTLENLMEIFALAVSGDSTSDTGRK
jgi:hypothetical protein